MSATSPARPRPRCDLLRRLAVWRSRTGVRRRGRRPRYPPERGATAGRRTAPSRSLYRAPWRVWFLIIRVGTRRGPLVVHHPKGGTLMFTFHGCATRARQPWSPRPDRAGPATNTTSSATDVPPSCVTTTTWWSPTPWSRSLGVVVGVPRRRASGRGWSPCWVVGSHGTRVRRGVGVGDRVGVCLDTDPYPDTPRHPTGQAGAPNRAGGCVATDPRHRVPPKGKHPYGC